ncbi:hypothetical protein Pcinc_042110 [Petrolisthes cinctipes]|uniref:PX domain-containing protein n=1 Tax=Petrolisthes cinctipes TaxID=88211 RepID=A0AAE1BL96_PETCI|nr:hypothetical protein Pcinc_042110 [Petrolisthes cinctipes]
MSASIYRLASLYNRRGIKSPRIVKRLVNLPTNQHQPPFRLQSPLVGAVALASEELKPLSGVGGSGGEDAENRSLLVQVTSLGRSWVLRRTYENFRFLDRQLHRCCYDRKFSRLPELPPEENLPGEDREVSVGVGVDGCAEVARFHSATSPQPQISSLMTARLRQGTH